VTAEDRLALSVDALRKAMAARRPDREDVVRRTCDLACYLDYWVQTLERKAYSTRSVEDLCKGLAEYGKDVGRSDWDAVEQLALALLALDAASHDHLRAASRKPSERDVQRSEAVRELVNKLAFPPGTTAHAASGSAPGLTRS
jgi:hypothetical protein